MGLWGDKIEIFFPYFEQDMPIIPKNDKVKKVEGYIDVGGKHTIVI
jgi:hypothetical protein